MNTIKDITDFIFVGKNINELSHYDLLIINADWAEEQLAKDLQIMFNKNIIDKNTLFIICESHQNSDRSSANILIDYLKKENINNRVIIDKKYITNPEILKNINNELEKDILNKEIIEIEVIKEVPVEVPVIKVVQNIDATIHSYKLNERSIFYSERNILVVDGVEKKIQPQTCRILELFLEEKDHKYMLEYSVM